MNIDHTSPLIAFGDSSGLQVTVQNTYQTSRHLEHRRSRRQSHRHRFPDPEPDGVLHRM
ncbi:MAG: hypothetical protein FWD61_19120 [Phycisphaerales bacterium]|nr:hypothetical protein [Phycisphaerales bacterium]